MTRQTNFARTGFLNIIVQVLYLALLYFAADTTPVIESEVAAFILRSAVVLIPSILWVMFFYWQDRIEPEPTRYVVAAFVVGMALANVFVLPLFRHFFSTELWIHDSLTLLSAGSFIIIGFVVSSALYFVLRYGFYPSREFDEPVDGMVYGAFIGAGFAAIESLQYLSAHSDYTLFAMGYTAASNVVVYASIGSIVGYFIGKGKFADQESIRHSLSGLVWGTFLLGSYSVMKEFIFLSGVQNALWISFVLSVVFAAAILGFVFLKMRKLTAKDLRQEKEVAFRLEMPVIALVLLVFIGGLFLKRSAMQDIQFVNEKYGVSFSYPHGFSPQPLRAKLPVRAAGITAQMQTLIHAVAFNHGEVGLTVSAKNGTADLSALDISTYIGSKEKISLSVEPVTIAGKEGRRVKYSYIDRTRTSVGGFPNVIVAYADVIPLRSSTVVLTFESNPDVFEEALQKYEKILSTIHWTAE